MPTLLGILFLSIAGFFGGWPWAVVGVAVLVIHWRHAFTLESVAATFALGLLWIGLYSWTGDRRFFFPYSMQFAVAMAFLLGGRSAWLASAGITALFAAIRIYQGATPFVLFVEMLVAAIILGAAFYAKGKTAPTVTSRVVAGTLGGLLAFFGLIVN